MNICCQNKTEIVKLLDSYNNGLGSTERIGIYKCRKCGQLWKIRHQCDPGTGCDDIWLRPGESSRGYTFTNRQAREFSE